MLVQKSAVTTQYGSGGAPKKYRLYSWIDSNAIIIPNFAIQASEWSNRFCIPIYTILVFLYCTTKSFKIYTSTMGPIRIPQDHILININMKNSLLLLLYPLFGFICRMPPSCVRPVMLENQFVTHLYPNKKTSRKVFFLMVVLLLVYDQCH